MFGSVLFAMQVLMVPQLTLLAAGIYPWPVLLKVVETAVAAAQQVLLSKVRSGRQGSSFGLVQLCAAACHVCRLLLEF